VRTLLSCLSSFPCAASTQVFTRKARREMGPCPRVRSLVREPSSKALSEDGHQLCRVLPGGRSPASHPWLRHLNPRNKDAGRQNPSAMSPAEFPYQAAAVEVSAPISHFGGRNLG